MKQFDIRIAYLNSDLTTAIFMHQSEEFTNPKHPKHVCQHFNGLKQSRRLWIHIFDAFLKLHDLITSHSDSCVNYRMTTASKVDLIDGIVVDDGIVCATSERDLDNVNHHYVLGDRRRYGLRRRLPGSPNLIYGFRFY